MKPSLFNIWLMAIRPKTLPAAVAPVLIGTAMAYRDNLHDFPTAIVALIGALLIQIGTNFANDYFDFKKGGDQKDRVGPTRVTQAGLVSPLAMKIAITVTFLLAALVSVYLIQRGGFPIALIGVFSILSGILYTAGPYPLGYLGLGELFVLFFFGPVAVAGTYYVQAMEMRPEVLIAGLGPGAISSAVLVINNLRDIDGDRRAGKKTLAVRFGRSFALSEYLFFVFLGVLTPVGIAFFTFDYPWTMIATLSLFLFISPIKTVLTKLDGASLNEALAATGKMLLVYSVLFAIGWVL